MKDEGQPEEVRGGSNPPQDVKKDTKETAAHLRALFRGLFAIGRDTIRSGERTVHVIDELISPLPQDAPGTQSGPVPEKTGRESDRELANHSEAARARRERWGTALVALTFLASMAAGVGFIAVYWTGGSNLLLGATLGICLGAAGAGMVFAAHLLMEHKQAIEPREELSSPEEERSAAEKAYSLGSREVRRRALLRWMMTGTVGVLAASAVSLLRSLGANPNSTLYGPRWKRGQRLMTIDGRTMTLGSLEPNCTVTVFPEDSIGSEKTQTVLIRVDQKLLRMPAERADWTPQGYVAYSRVCTHAGCPVGLYLTTTCQLLCPCHQSTFDVLRAATPTGGPAARALPQLPLYADSDGTLRAAGDFNYPTGPGFWGMP